MKIESYLVLKRRMSQLIGFERTTAGSQSFTLNRQFESFLDQVSPGVLDGRRTTCWRSGRRGR